MKAETQIETQNNSRIWDVLNGKSCGDFHIDYDVTMPAANRLDLSNRYGNSTVGILQNSVKIDQRYGDFRLDGATIATVQLAYGGGQMGNLTALNGSVSYGRLTSPMIKDAQLRSKYSNFKFDHVGSLDIQSAYDDYDLTDVASLKADAQYGNIIVGSVENLSAAGSYTTFKVKKLEQNADFKTNYGEIRIGSIKAGFGTLNIVGKQTDCLIAVDPSVSYQLDVVGAYTDLQNSAALKPKVDREERYRREIMVANVISGK